MVRFLMGVLAGWVLALWLSPREAPRRRPPRGEREFERLEGGEE